MGRPRALPNADLFALARQLLAEGEQPSITKLAEKAKAEYGVSPSYTTLKQVLQEWRQIEAANAPKTLPTEFLNAVLTALTPLYGRLIAQARAEFEPIAATACRERDEAESERERTETERTRLIEEVSYLRRQVEETRAREQQAAAALADIGARAATLEASLAAVRARNDELAKEMATVRAAAEATDLEHRVEAARWMQERESIHQSHANELAELHQLHARTLRTMMDEAEGARREHAKALQQSDAQISELERERREQQAATEELRVRLQAVQEAMTVAQNTIERQAQESATLIATRERLSAELSTTRIACREERHSAQARIQALEEQVTALVQARASLDERYENLLAALETKRGHS